ncbi:MAG TPA: hypothetical protein DCR97_12265 [Deltaproteobacteria bacterium]|nr:hypothetical protein [Deltaproteobacteria bacterium]
MIKTIRSILPGKRFLAYLTKSATPENQKCRVILGYSSLCPGDDHVLVEQILNDRLQKAGITPDRKTEQAGQICYLPNAGDFYDHHLEQGEPLDLIKDLGDELNAKRILRIEAEQRRQQQRVEARRKAEERLASGIGSPIDAYNAANPIEDVLESYGYKKKGDRYLSPNSSSGTPGVSVKDGRWISSHGSDEATIGKSGDAFDLFVFFDHRGDFDAAMKAAAGTYCQSRGDSSSPGVEFGPDFFENSGQATVAAVASVAVAKWPEPISLVVNQRPDPYPLEALPGVIGEAVKEVVGFVQCPVALAACSALSAVSTVVQGLADIRRSERLEGPTSLYCLAIADSGERKSTADDFFSRPIRDWETHKADEKKVDLKRFAAENQAWEARKAGILTAIKETAKKGKDTKTLETNLGDLEANEPEGPTIPRVLFGDATPEALAFKLAHGWPVGGVLSSEAGIVFGGHAMGKDSAMRNMALLNSLWGAERVTIDRKTGPSFVVQGARLTMGLAVQSETVRAFLDSSKGLARGIGWLARFLIAWPESTQGTRLFRDPPHHWPHLEKFHMRLGSLLDSPLSFDEFGNLSPDMLELSPEAKAAWVAFHDEVEAELRPGRDMAETRDVASKAADNAARLAGLFHVFENGPAGHVGIDHMEAAASIIAWHLYEARRFLGEIALPVAMTNALKLDEWILRYCRENGVSGISTRNIQQWGPGCTRDRKALQSALEELVDAARVRVVKYGRRILVEVNPALLEK